MDCGIPRVKQQWMIWGLSRAGQPVLQLEKMAIDMVWKMSRGQKELTEKLEGKHVLRLFKDVA